ncbi:MAG: nitroreductase family protein [Pseudomonadota bacterium]
MTLADRLTARFGDAFHPVAGTEGLEGMAARGSCRRFSDQPVARALIETLAAVALSAPTKSDLQQRDILIVSDPELRAELDRLCGTQSWLPGAPVLLIFLANHRRQRRLSEMHGLDFVNDHADAPFNAAMDAAIAMGAFVAAAERVGLGCCPVSAIRNTPEAVARLLNLPDRVFPAVALALGWPSAPPEIAMRLPLSVTLHENRFEDGAEDAATRAYDTVRAAHQPYSRQRAPETFGVSAAYGWSEDKARQYALPERTGFGAYLKRIGFRLD